MATSPFELFRRNLKPLMIALTVLAMFAFVVLPALQSYQQMSQPGGTTDTTVASYDGGSFEISEIDYFNRNHNLTLRFLSALAEKTMERGGTPQVPGFFQDPRSGAIQSLGINSNVSGQSAVTAKLFAAQAEEMGMELDDAALRSWLDRFVDSKLTPGEVNGVLAAATDNQLGQFQLYEQLRTHLLASAAQQVVRAGLVGGNQLTTPPAEQFDLFRRLNQQAVVTAYPVLVDDFVKKVTAQPTDAEIKTLYEEGKERYPDESSAEPAFRRPATRSFEYVTADLQAFIDEEAKTIPEEELRAEYERQLAGGAFQLPEMPAQTATEGEPAAEQPATNAAETVENSSESQPSDAQEPGNESPEAGDESSESDSQPPAENDDAADSEPETPAEPSQVDSENAEPAETNSDGNESSSEDAPAEADDAEGDDAEGDDAEGDDAEADDAEADDAEADDAKNEDAAESAEQAGDDENASARRSTDAMQLVAFRAQQQEDAEADSGEEEAAPASDAASETEPAAAGNAVVEEQPASSDEAPAEEETPAASEETNDAASAEEDQAMAAKDEASADAETQADADAAAPADDAGAGDAARAEETPQVRSFAEVREEIARQLATAPATAKAQAATRKVYDAMRTYFTRKAIYDGDRDQSTDPPQRPDVPAMAEELGLEYGDTGSLDKVALQNHPLGNTASRGVDMQVGERFPNLVFQGNIPPESPVQTQNVSTRQPYVSWITSAREESLPDLAEIREEVVAFWRLQKARELAQEAAQKLAAQANESEQPLTELVPEDRRSLVAESVGPFPWMLWLGPGRQPIEWSVQELDRTGKAFMRQAFHQPLDRYGVAPNEPKTVYYTLKTTDRTPELEELRDRFMQLNERRPVSALASEDIGAIQQGYFSSFTENLGLEWSDE